MWAPEPASPSFLSLCLFSCSRVPPPQEPSGRGRSSWLVQPADSWPESGRGTVWRHRAATAAERTGWGGSRYSIDISFDTWGQSLKKAAIFTRICFPLWCPQMMWPAYPGKGTMQDREIRSLGIVGLWPPWRSCLPCPAALLVSPAEGLWKQTRMKTQRREGTRFCSFSAVTMMWLSLFDWAATLRHMVQEWAQRDANSD